MTDETTARHCEACGQVRVPDDYWQRKITYWQDLACANRKVAEENQTRLAAAIAHRDKAVADADYFFVLSGKYLQRANDAEAQRDKAIEFLQVYRNDTPLGHQPHMIAHEVDQFLKECGK